MASFAKIGLNSKVIGVHAVDNSDLLNADGIEEEEVGRQFLERLHGWPLWIQTSTNTSEGVHKLGGTPLRKNYAGIGMIWDEDKDMFYHKQPHASWTLDESKGLWDPPIPIPRTKTNGDDDSYSWDEETKTWNKD
tara:strand:- start:98 stop:502 length:405 start_codon:yes stop_codon:yes gene_type:complete